MRFILHVFLKHPNIECNKKSAQMPYSIGARTFRLQTFWQRTFQPGHFGHRHFGHGNAEVDISGITINFGFGMYACINV